MSSERDPAAPANHPPLPEKRLVISVIRGACRVTRELGTAEALLEARRKRLPILPARCPHCRVCYSQQSLDYLRAVIIAQGAIQPAHRSEVTVWLLGEG